MLDILGDAEEKDRAKVPYAGKWYSKTKDKDGKDEKGKGDKAEQEAVNSTALAIAIRTHEHRKIAAACSTAPYLCRRQLRSSWFGFAYPKPVTKAPEAKIVHEAAARLSCALLLVIGTLTCE